MQTRNLKTPTRRRRIRLRSIKIATRLQELGLGTSSSSASGAALLDRVTTAASGAKMIPPQSSHSGRGTKRDARK